MTVDGLHFKGLGEITSSISTGMRKVICGLHLLPLEMKIYSRKAILANLDINIAAFSPILFNFCITAHY